MESVQKFSQFLFLRFKLKKLFYEGAVFKKAALITNFRKAKKIPVGKIFLRFFVCLFFIKLIFHQWIDGETNFTVHKIRSRDCSY